MNLKQIRPLLVDSREMGFLNAGMIALARLLPRNYEVPLKPIGHEHSLYCRGGRSSDSTVFRQIYAFHEYAPLQLKEPKLIIDCGANVGYSSVYFLEKFPSAHVVAIEPDPSNFRLLVKNLTRFGSRAEAIQGGIWSETGKLKTVLGEFGDGREWATTVREVNPNENPDTLAFDIPAVTPVGYDRISLLKIDIEGAEIELFSNGSNRWLPLVDNLAIELHGEEANKVFFDALNEYQYDLLLSGELTICQNLRKRAQPVPLN